MNLRRTGALVAVGLAAGIAIGAAGSAIAASATGQPSAGGWAWMSRMVDGAEMMNGAGMMGAGAPGGSFGPGMIPGMTRNPGSADRNGLLQRCDELHDAMHAAARSASPTHPS